MQFNYDIHFQYGGFMPYKITKKKGGEYQVKGGSGVHAKGTTIKKAKAQVRLLRAVEYGWKPTATKGMP